MSLEIRLPILIVSAVLLGSACGGSASPKDADENPSTATDDSDGTGATDDGSEPPSRDGSAPRIDAGKDASVPATSTGSDAAASDGAVSSGNPGDASTTPTMPTTPGACCDDGNCLCHGPDPVALTADPGPYKTANYALSGAGCVFYPMDAEPPFAAVTISDGFGGTGGCGAFSQTGQWGPLYASWGIVAMIIDTGSGDQPNVRGMKLSAGVAAFKAENTKSGSPLEGKLAGRYGTSGFSMGGGGTSYASKADSSLLSSVAIMPWGPVTSGVNVPTLVICGSSDTIAPCAQHGNGLYSGIPDSVSKMRVQVTSSHFGQPSGGSSMSGKYGLAFTKVFLEGDQRWRPFLVSAMSEQTNIK